MAETLAVKKLVADAVIPTRGTIDSAGLDLYAAEDALIPPHETKRVPTGISIALPKGTVGFIKPRSSSFFAGLDLDGTIDADYRGPVLMQIRNTSNIPYHIAKGNRYAQLVVLPYAAVTPTEVDVLPDTDRGEGGFGSTGR